MSFTEADAHLVKPPHSTESRERLKAIAYVTSAALMWSTAGIWVRFLHLDIWTIQCGRAMFGALSLTIYLLFAHRRRVLSTFASINLAGWIVVPINALGMMAYMQALNWTTVANVMVVYTILPFVVAALGWVWIREAVRPRTLIASAVALSGVLVMVGGSIETGRVAGDVASFVMVLSFAALVILARRYPAMSMPAHSVLSGVLCAAVAFPFAHFDTVSWRDLVILAILGSITIGIANVFYMRGVARLPAAEAGLIGLLDTVIAPVWVFFLFSEKPGDSAIVGGVVVLCAVIYQILGERRRVEA